MFGSKCININDHSVGSIFAMNSGRSTNLKIIVGATGMCKLIVCRLKGFFSLSYEICLELCGMFCVCGHEPRPLGAV